MQKLIKKKALEDIDNFKEKLNTSTSMMIGLIGRINEFKGQYLLIEAMKELRQKDLNIKAFIVGSAMDQNYLENLKQKVKEYHLR